MLTACSTRISVLEISNEDIKYFDELLARPSEEIRFFPSFDNTPLACTVIRPKNPSQGVVLFIHGIGARANLYLPLADELAANGYSVYLLDIRGHGYSHGIQGHMPSAEAMAEDITHFYEYVSGIEGSNKNYIAMGHSLGTYIWINTLSSNKDIDIDALVLISGGSIIDLIDSDSDNFKNFTHIKKWKAFLSIFNHNIKPVHIIFPDIPQFRQAGFVQDYGISFFSMFNNFEKRFMNTYKNTQVPILMISGSRDELFDADKLHETYNLIDNENKEFQILDGKTHTSIIWSVGYHIKRWLVDYLPTNY